MEERPLLAIREALDFMAFGLDQFQERADRDGASLAILATESMSMGTKNVRQKPERAPINTLREMADARGIPVIDLYDYAIRQGEGEQIKDRLLEMRFAHDYHWNEIGHRRAAEAVLEYLKANPSICDTQTS